MLSRYLKRSVIQNARYQQICGVDGTSRKHATQAEFKKNESETAEVSYENAKPCEEIPGPSGFEFVRSVMPGGRYFKKSITDMVMDMNSRYGDFFRLPGLFGNRDVLVSMNPADYPLVFRLAGTWPYRRSFESLTYHREVLRADVFQGVEGILNTSGEKWAKVRSVVNPVLMQPKNTKLYLNTMLEVNDEFLARIREIRDPVTHEMPDTFEDEINRLAFESVAAVALNKQLGLIRKNRDTAESKILLKSLRNVFDLAFHLDIMPSLWKVIKTPKFYEMMKTLDTLNDICTKYINEALARIETDAEGKVTSEVGKETSVVEKLARIDKRIAVVMALDMMMAGVDTTSTTLIGILLGIGKNPEKQAILLEEIKQVLPQKDSKLLPEHMHNLPYLRACIKEGIRMYPIGPGTMRRMPQNVVLSGYRIPEGSDVTMGSNLQMTDERFVPRAKEFIPERFLRDENNKNRLEGEIANAFMYVPFGFGPRSCAGKRIVDLELEINVARLVRNFNIEFNYSIENAFTSKFINVPNIPLNFKFEERKE